MSDTDRLKRARIALLLDEPFFGSLLMQMKITPCNTCPRFTTDGTNLLYNPEYLATLSDPQLRTVLAHEVMHPALLHPYRLGDRDLRLANEAADYAVNGFLDNYNIAARARGEAPPFVWPEIPGKPGTEDILLDHKYDNLAFEQIYAELQSQPPPPPQGGGTPPSGGSGLPSPGGEGQGEGEPPQPSGPGEFTAPPLDDAQTQAAEAQWKVALKQAATMAKSQGRLPAEMERLVTELLEPKAHWREILRTFLTSAAHDDYTWSRPNRRFSNSPLHAPRSQRSHVIMPSLHVPRLGTIAVAIDTSGSIGQEQLNAFLAEVSAILFDCRPAKLILIQCDAAIQNWQELDPSDELKLEMKGGGGTDFCPVFERLAEEPDPPAALVYLTDLAGTFPDEPPAYPVIWACTDDTEAPFGETIHI